MQPDVFRVLQGFGFTQGELAAAFHVHQSAVSQWASGRHGIAPGVLEDLWELASLARERARQGGDPRELLSTWQPTMLLAPGGRATPVTQAVAMDIPPDLVEPLKAAAARRDFVVMDWFYVEAALEQFSALRGREQPLSATELAALRRASMSLKSAVAALQQRLAEGE